MAKIDLDTEVTYIKGFGPYIAEQLKKVGIKTVSDLINYFPFRHEDLSDISNIDSLLKGELTGKNCVLRGSFTKPTTFRTKNGKQITQSSFSDGSGKVKVWWFNSKYIMTSLKTDKLYSLVTKPTVYKNPVIINPQLNIVGDLKGDLEQVNDIHTGRIIPVYFNINGIAMKTLRKGLNYVFENIDIEDFITSKKSDYLSLQEAYRTMHFPENEEDVEKAKNRIGLNELIHTSLHGLKVKDNLKGKTSRFVLKNKSKKALKLPFELTEDQDTAVTDVLAELSKPYPLNSLVSGDVGSGKTIVSILIAFQVIKGGGKVLYLAPTVVLAKQVHEEYKKFLEKEGIKVGIYTAKEKDDIDECDVIVGTHALLNVDGISDFADLVVVDEQHKFGVKQRVKLLEGGKVNNTPPHLLTMTATPIPRSLALTYFSELKLIPIKSKPKNRIPITTKALTKTRRQKCLDWIIKEKQKTYFIVPFIQESESELFKDVRNIEQTEKELVEVFGKENLLVLHGKMKDEEKNRVVDEFRKREWAVLLSTQVVEVGVDVKDATVIIIESAERFGLASLHQLRGRVGRGDLKSYCFLFTSFGKITDRLKLLEQINDGFKLSEKDLETRGGGEVFGIRQSGELDLKFVDFTNKELIEEAQKIAKNVYKDKDILQKYLDHKLTRDLFLVKDN